MEWLSVFWKRWGSRWLPVVLWMAVIFFFSTRTKAEMPHCPNDLLDWPVKKIGHMIEYGILALLVWRATSGTLGLRARRWHIGIIAAICISYAASDEYHQSFVAGRGSNISDVVIDTLGMALSLIGMSALLRFRARCPASFQRLPRLDRFLAGFLPIRPVAHDNLAERSFLMDR